MRNLNGGAAWNFVEPEEIMNELFGNEVGSADRTREYATVWGELTKHAIHDAKGSYWEQHHHQRDHANHEIREHAYHHAMEHEHVIATQKPGQHGPSRSNANEIEDAPRIEEHAPQRKEDAFRSQANVSRPKEFTNPNPHAHAHADANANPIETRGNQSSTHHPPRDRLGIGHNTAVAADGGGGGGGGDRFNSTDAHGHDGSVWLTEEISDLELSPQARWDSLDEREDGKKKKKRDTGCGGDWDWDFS